MSWIDTIPDDAADGELQRLYEQAYARAGRVFNIVRVMSQNPAILRASMDQYLAVMYKPSPLSRALRELLAVMVSKANACHY